MGKAQDDSFGRLPANKIARRMAPAIDELYKEWWPDCKIKRVIGSRLDRKMSIDTVVQLETGAVLTIQEKTRESKYLTNPNLQVTKGCPDFTQEIIDAYDTPQERPGEWHHLYAQLYFYCWENKERPGQIAEFLVLNVADYIGLVAEEGGLQAMGQIKNNLEHGKAVFYAVPVYRLAPVITSCSAGIDRHLLAHAP